METSTIRPQGADGTDGSNSSTFLRSVDQAGAVVHETIDKVKDPAHKAVDRATATAHSAVDSLTGTASTVAEKVSASTAKLRETSADAVNETVAFIQEKPFQAIGIALAVGFVLGRLTGGSSRDY